MLRRLATSLAATSALVLTATAPALADHVEYPDDPTLFTAEDEEANQGGVVTCENLGLEPLLDKVEEPVEGKDTDEVTTTVTDDAEAEPTFLDVEAKEGFEITAVIVKGMNASLVYFHGPFEGLTAPDKVEISHYLVCGHEEGDDDETPTPTPTPTPTETTTSTPAPVPTAVPAGTSGSGDASMAPVGIAAAALMVVAGGAALLRRRFAHQS